MTPESSHNNSFRIAATVTAVNVLIATGFSLAGLISPEFIVPPTATPNEASEVFAMYSAARTLPLAAFALYVIYRRSVAGLLVIGGLAGVVQGADAVVGFYHHDWVKGFGPVGVAVAQFVSLYWLRVRRLST